MDKLRILILCLLCFLPSSTSAYLYDTPYNESPNTQLNKISNPIHKEILQSVIKVEITKTNDAIGTYTFFGTAFAVYYDSDLNATYFITNNHLCEPREGTQIKYSTAAQVIEGISNYNPNNNLLSIVSVRAEDDLCLLRADDTKFQTVTFEKSKLSNIMDTIYTIGGPTGVFPIWNTGKLCSFINRQDYPIEWVDKGHDFLLFSGLVVKGQSGSPIYTENGYVIGVIFASIETNGRSSNSGLAIPSESVMEFLNQTI